MVEKKLFSYNFLFGFNVYQGIKVYKFFCRIFNFKILFHSKAVRKLIIDFVGTITIFKNPIKTGFTIIIIYSLQVLLFEF